MQTAAHPVVVFVALMLFAAACTAGEAAPEEEEEHFPTPTVVNPALPVDPGNTMTSEQLANSDPCGLVDVDALSTYGEVETERESINQWGCTANLSGDDTIWHVKIALESTLSAAAVDSAYSSRDHYGLTIYSGPFHDILGCPREVVAAPDAVVDVWTTSAASETENCALADAAVEGVVAKLLAGDLPPSVMASNSLAMQDACTLLEPAEANQVPEIDLSHLNWTYHGQSCTWGDDPDGSSIYISFGPFISWLHTLEEEEEVEVGGYQGLIAQGVELDGLNVCELAFDYRPLDFPDFYGSTESVKVIVHAPAEPSEVCDLTEELAATAASRLARA